MAQQSKCPVCKSDTIARFLKRERVPVHQNLVVKDQRSALEVPRGDLNLAVCEQCGFIFNETFELSKLSYGDDYDNTQSFSSVFEDYLSHLARYLIFEKGVQNCHIVEIGCGKGLFLKKMIEIGGGNIGYGFDPSYVGPATDMEGRLHFEKCYYGPECADIPANVIICRHVIEHVPNPLDVLHTIRQALTNSLHAKVFFETPTVEWILRNQVIWDFFYEHCSYFTVDSLTTAFETSGFRVDSVRTVFGEQYLWLEATLLPPGEKPVVTKRPGYVPYLARNFAMSESELKRVWEGKIQELAPQGGIALWGAGAKGVTFANLVDSERQWITCVVDLNPQKQGHYIPGTGHPIVSYQELPGYGVGTAILMNPNYRDENLELLREAHINVHLLDLMEWCKRQT